MPGWVWAIVTTGSVDLWKIPKELCEERDGKLRRVC
jgi:hypothetical protein